MRLVVCNTLTNAILGTTVPSSLKWSEPMNAAGTATATVSRDAWLNMFAPTGPRPYRACIYVIDADAPRPPSTPPPVPFSGPIIRARHNRKARTVTITAASWHHMLHRRRLTSPAVFTGTDQSTIATTLVSLAQTGTDADLGITFPDVTPTGILRDRTEWDPADRPIIGKLLEDLADVQGGFLFRFRALFDGTGPAPARRFELQYPRTGRPTSIVYRADVNAEVDTVDIDGLNVADTVDLLASKNNERLILTRTQSLPGYPHLATVVSAGTATETDTLAEKGDGILAAGNIDVTSIRAVVLNSQRSGVELGDAVRVIVSDMTIDDTFVVLGRSTTYKAGNTVDTLDLVPAELLDI